MHEKLGLTAVGPERWEPLPGYPGLEQVPLSGHLDEAARTGRRVRLVRFAPGARTSETLVHDYFEETYLVEGELALSEDASARITAPAFVFRPPGTPHGPFVSGSGCVMIEIQYYA